MAKRGCNQLRFLVLITLTFISQSIQLAFRVLNIFRTMQAMNFFRAGRSLMLNKKYMS